MSSDSEKPATDAKPEDKPIVEDKPKATDVKPEDKSKVAEDKPKATDAKPEDKPLVEDKPKATVTKPEDKPIVADKPKTTAPPAKKPEEKPVELPAFEKSISDKIVEKFGDKIKVAFVKKDRVRINVSRENVHDVAEFIRDGLNYDHVESVTGVDFPAEKEIEVVYHIGSYTDSSLARQILVLATRAQREENPIPGSDSTRLPTLRDIFYSVEFHEREIFEMLGVYFDGHPDNRRLLLPEDWADLPPLRKDFAIKGR